jgi:two-component system OmpR family response regulator
MRILVIEDDEDLADAIVRRLRRLGHAVDLQKDGLSADGVLQYETFDLVILDIGLPRMSGFDILHRLRDRGSKTPVLALTARIDIEDRVHALDTGADDYLAKPFEMGELVARFRGLVRRSAGRLSPVITAGRLALDTRRMSATLDGAPVRLSPLEFRLLDCLAHQPGRAVSAGELAEHLYGLSESGDANAIEALIVRLRRKIGSEAIETHRGFGYRLAGMEG